VGRRGGHIGLLNAFFTAVRGFGWDETLPASATFFPEDYPRPPSRLPRYLAEHIMAQVETTPPTGSSPSS
jgi:hypothetical protein